jgi:hypothetical protein
MWLAGKGSRERLMYMPRGEGQKVTRRSSHVIIIHHSRHEKYEEAHTFQKEANIYERDEMRAKKKAERELMSIFCFTECHACLVPYANQTETPIYVYSVGKAKEGRKKSQFACKTFHP